MHGQVAAATRGPVPNNYSYRLSQKRIIFAGEVYLNIYVEWVGNHFGLSLT